MLNISPKSLNDLNDEKINELEELIEKYNLFKCYLEIFIDNNNLFEDEIWEKVENYYEESLSRKNG